MKILVLGSGRMGLGAAYDLAHNSDVEAVTVADLDMERARSVAAFIAELSKRDINLTTKIDF